MLFVPLMSLMTSPGLTLPRRCWVSLSSWNLNQRNLRHPMFLPRNMNPNLWRGWLLHENWIHLPLPRKKIQLMPTSLKASYQRNLLVWDMSVRLTHTISHVVWLNTSFTNPHSFLIYEKQFVPVWKRKMLSRLNLKWLEVFEPSLKTGQMMSREKTITRTTTTDITIYQMTLLPNWRWPRVSRQSLSQSRVNPIVQSRDEDPESTDLL